MGCSRFDSLCVACVCCSGDAAAASSFPVEHSAPADDDEWSEAWAEYKRECAEEDADAAARGITDSDVATQTSQPEQPLPPKPLSALAVDKIKGVMAGIKLKPPIWALKYVMPPAPRARAPHAVLCCGIRITHRRVCSCSVSHCLVCWLCLVCSVSVPEEVWMAQILARAGVRPAGATAAASAAATNGSSSAAAASASASAALDKQKTEERKKRAKQKKKRAAKAAAAAAAAAAADADFEAHFPAVTASASTDSSPAANSQQSTAAALQTPD